MGRRELLRVLPKTALREILEWLVSQDRLSQDDGYSGWSKEERVAFLARKLDDSTVRNLCRAAGSSSPFFTQTSLAKHLGLPSKDAMLWSLTKDQLHQAMRKLAKERSIRVDWQRYNKDELVEYLRRTCSADEIAVLIGLRRRSKKDDQHSATPEDGPSEERSNEAALAFAELVRDHLIVDSLGNGWPLTGLIKTTTAKVPATIYVRPIGRSGRERPTERRFQNPGRVEHRALVEPMEGYCLLLGLWDEQGLDRAVVVAMDAYRRIDKETRFSLFMPLSLLEEAADTGYAQHHNSKGEELHAFRPEGLTRYLESLLADLPLQGVSEPLSSTPSRVTTPATVSIAPASPPTNGTSVHIRPRVGMYAAFARLNYRPWFAIAEFVDNSVQSFLHHRERLRADVGDTLLVDIEIDEDEIRVTDRAGGIAWTDFPRAFSPSQPPPDAGGLSEFGLGMKAAACWFARRWSVRTSALGEPVCRSIDFDIPRISREGIEHLPIQTEQARDGDHYTVVALRNLRVRPRGRTVTKIKAHLSSIYRVLMRKGVVQLRLTNAAGMEELRWEEPEILRAPYFRDIGGPERVWRKDFEFEVGGKRVWGWAGLLAHGRLSQAGFSVFRRDRLIQGSADETYRPEAVFGKRNSFRQQRLVGEIFVEGFDVSHTKDGIQWGGDEDDMLEILRRELDGGDLPLLKQAEGHRSRKPAAKLEPGFGNAAVSTTGGLIQTPATSAILASQAKQENRPEDEPEVPAPAPERTLTRKTMILKVADHPKPWSVTLELVDDAAREWFGCSTSENREEQLLSVYLNLAHPFSERFLNESEEVMTPIIRLVAALALSEHTARLSGVKYAGEIRKRVNQLLREALSQSTAEDER